MQDLPQILLYQSQRRLIHRWIIPLDGFDGRQRSFHGLGYLHRCRFHVLFDGGNTIVIPARRVDIAYIYGRRG